MVRPPGRRRSSLTFTTRFSAAISGCSGQSSRRSPALTHASGRRLSPGSGLTSRWPDHPGAGLRADPGGVRDRAPAGAGALNSSPRRGNCWPRPRACMTTRSCSCAPSRACGIRVALVSNCMENTRPLLSGLGVSALADAVVLSCETGCAKPDARIYRQALDQLGVRAGAAVLVDDQPAFCAGAAAVGIDRPADRPWPRTAAWRRPASRSSAPCSKPSGCSDASPARPAGQ